MRQMAKGRQRMTRITTSVQNASSSLSHISMSEQHGQHLSTVNVCSVFALVAMEDGQLILSRCFRSIRGEHLRRKHMLELQH